MNHESLIYDHGAKKRMLFHTVVRIIYASGSEAHSCTLYRTIAVVV